MQVDFVRVYQKGQKTSSNYSHQEALLGHPYPNPCSGKLNVEECLGPLHQQNFSIWSSTGALVQKGTAYASNSIINLEHLDYGLYFLIFESGAQYQVALVP